MKKVLWIALCIALLCSVLPAVGAAAAEAELYAAPSNKNDSEVLEGDQTAGTVTFGVLSDVHISEEPNRVENRRFITALEYFAAKGADTTFVVGDLTNNGSAAQYRCYADTITAAETGDMTVHESMGNHDTKGDYDDFVSYTGDALNSHFKINGYHFITLHPDTSISNDSYILSMLWLSNQLKIAAADTGSKPIFVFAHHAIKNTVYVSSEWYGNLQKFQFNDYPQVVFFSGHSHAPNTTPTSIWQDDFTAINTVTLSYMELESGYGDDGTCPPGCDQVAEGMLITVDGSKVTVVNHDFISGLDIVEQTWVFDTSAQKTGDPASFPYNHEIRKQNSKAPVFPKDAKITIDDISTDSVSFTFDQAETVPEDIPGDIVHAYRYKLCNADGKVVTETKDWSKFYFYPMPATLSKTLSGLKANTDYTLYIYPINAYGVEGKPISVSFSVGGYYTPKPNVLNVNFNSVYGTADANGHALTVFGEPVVDANGTLPRTTARFDGKDDGFYYKLSESDYDKFKKHFTYELYFKLEAYSGGYDIFSGTESAGIGLTQTETGVQFWARLGSGSYTKIPISVPENEWSHLVVSYDGSALKVYVNGEQQTSVSKSGTLKIPTEKARCMVIGGDTDENGKLQTPSKCEIALARVYGGVMNAEDVKLCYSAAVAERITTELVIDSVDNPAGTVKVQFTSAQPAGTTAAFYMACYDAAGRMLGLTAETKTVETGENQLALPLPNVSGAVKYQVMAVESVTDAPLCASATYTKN